MLKWSTLTMLAFPCLAWAQSGIPTEDDFLADVPMVLTASRIGQTPLDAPAPVTVLDRALIDASGFTEIQDLLRLVPGFLVSDTPLISPVVLNHGLGDLRPRRLQVLINGSSVFDPLLGGVNWDDLPLRVQDIERIEVVRAPNPSTYGANSFQGVINIITVAPFTGQRAGVMLRAGRPDLNEAYAYIERGDAELDWRLSVSRRSLTTFDEAAQLPSRQVGEDTNRDVFNGQATWRPSHDQEFNLQLGLVQGEDNLSSGDLYRNRDPESRFFQVAWQKTFSSDSTLSFQYFHFDSTLDYRYDELPYDSSLAPVPSLSVDKSTHVRRDDLEMNLSQRWTEALRTLWGVSVRNDKAEAPGLLYGQGTVSGWQGQAFGTLDWQALPDWRLQAGGMLEKHYNTDTLFSPRLALNYRASPNQSLRFSIGKGYRAPTIYETRAREAVSYEGGIAEVGQWATRELEPESVRYVDLGYVADFQPAGLKVDARLFYNRYKDFIDEQSCILDPETQNSPIRKYGPDCDFAPPPGYERPLGFSGQTWRNPDLPFGTLPRYGHYKAFYYFNSGDIDIKGGDITLDWNHRDWGRWRITHAITRIEATGLGIDDTLNIVDLNKDVDFEDSAPSHSTSLLWSKTLPWWDLSAHVGYYRVGSMEWPNGGRTQPPFKRFDLKLVKRLGKATSPDALSLTIQNVNDEHLEFDNYLMERRAFLTLELGW